MIADYVPLGLQKGDRLEPTPKMPLTDKFDSMARPIEACFWRPSKDTLTRHRNPLFSSISGLRPAESLVPDWLHALSLGEFQFFVNVCWHKLLEANIFQSQASTASLRKHEFIREVKSLLFAWYAEQRRNGREVVAVQDLTSGMFSDDPGSDLGIHGAETNYALEFTVRELLPKYQAKITDYANLSRCGNALWGVLQLIRSKKDGAFDIQDAISFVSHVKDHSQASRLFDLRPKPKRHQLLHMSGMLLTHGSPFLWGCWSEEGLNRWHKKTCQRSHRAVWGHRTITEFNATWGPGGRSLRPTWIDMS